jgi:hypothetical protein
MATGTARVPDVRKQFEQSGFIVVEAAGSPGAIEVRKSNFVAYLESKDGRWVRSGPPYFVGHGINCELEDRGYQKFWFSRSDDKRFPIRKIELESLHRFDEEVRHILGQTSLYNEALGSTNARTVYDRLAGRPDR